MQDEEDIYDAVAQYREHHPVIDCDEANIFTEQESKVMKAICNAWEQFQKLPVEHPDDNNEFRFHIHALQNMVASRVGLRIYNNLIP